MPQVGPPAFPSGTLFTRGRRTFKIEVQSIIRFSSGKSKSVCAEWSGKVPRLCAIWTPQCGGMKGKLCFIKRKSRNLVSNCRSFCVENISIFENRERTNEKLWTFLREQVLKGNKPLYNRGFTCFLLSSHLRVIFYLLLQRYKVLFLHAIERPIFSL